MATVNVEVNGRTYVVGCEDGQEEHVRGLARQFDKQVQEVGQQVGSVGELRLFLLAALTTADELNETRSRLVRGDLTTSTALAAPPLF
jgi:cell division protein ZapA